MQITAKTRQTLDEMWIVFGDDMIEMLNDLQKVEDVFEIPEDLTEFLSVVSEYVDQR